MGAAGVRERVLLDRAHDADDREWSIAGDSDPPTDRIPAAEVAPRHLLVDVDGDGEFSAPLADEEEEHDARVGPRPAPSATAPPESAETPDAGEIPSEDPIE